MYKNVVTFFLMGMLAGCVSTRNIPLTDDVTNNIIGNSVTKVSREKPDFGAMTARKEMFGALGGVFGGALGGVSTISAGNKIIKENEVEDPANYISEALIKDLSQKYNLNVIDMDNTIASSKKVSELSKQYGDVDLLIDVRTINWMFSYFPTDWDNYRVSYSAKLRLIDTHNNKVLAEGFCSRVPDKTDSSPTYDELLANKATRLKEELKVAADYCIQEFRSKTLGI